MAKRSKQASADYLHVLLMMNSTIEHEWEFVSATSDGWVTFKQGERSFRAREANENTQWCVDFELDDEYIRAYSIEELVCELNGLYSYVRVDEHHE